MIVTFNIIWALVSTIYFPKLIADETISFSNSYFSVLMMILIYIVLWRSATLARDRRREVLSHILGFLFAFLTAAGNALNVYGNIGFGRIIIPVLVFAHVIAEVISLLWTWLVDFEKKLDKKTEYGKIIIWIFNHKYVITIALLLCWLPMFIADFPGRFWYDATGELDQINSGFRGDYPLLHSVIITRLLPCMYSLTGSYAFGVAIYVSVQMILIAIMYTDIVCTFAKRKVNKYLLLGIIIYCGLFNVIQILVVQEVRDIMFSALLTYLMFLFYLMTTGGDEYWNKVSNPIRLATVLVLTLLARNNNAGMTMIIVVSVVSLTVWLCYRKAHFKGVTVFTVTSIGEYIILGMILTALCQPLAPAAATSSMSVVSQSLARAYTYEKDEWEEDEIDELKRFMNIEGLGYDPQNADHTKYLLYAEGQKGELLKFWIKEGLRHPKSYINAYLANNQDMWFPDSVVDGYGWLLDVEGQDYYGCEKTYIWIGPKMEGSIEHYNLWPSVLEYYRKIGLFISFEKVPVISMLFSIGFNFWIILICMFYIIFRKKKKLYMSVIVLALYMFGSSFVPLVILRYFAAAFLAMPMIIVFLLQPDRLNDTSIN